MAAKRVTKEKQSGHLPQICTWNHAVTRKVLRQFEHFIPLAKKVLSYHCIRCKIKQLALTCIIGQYRLSNHLDTHGLLQNTLQVSYICSVGHYVERIYLQNDDDSRELFTYYEKNGVVKLPTFIWRLSFSYECTTIQTGLYNPYPGFYVNLLWVWHN